MRRPRLSVKRLLVFGAVLVATGVAGLLFSTQHAVAFSSYLSAARTQYPSITGTALDSCALCHPAGGYTLNAYATAYQSAGHNFTAIENLDSDGDEYTNIAEIRALTFPGDANSHPNGNPTATPTRPAPTATATHPGPTATATRSAPTATPTSGVPAPTATRAGPTPTPVGVPTPVPPVLPNRGIFVGSVGSLPSGQPLSGDWQVGSRTVHVNNFTWLEQQSLLGRNSRVWVFGPRRPDGSVDAQYIRVLTAASGGGDD
jgi:hypothetical protein